jgi:aspartyl-tRNA(Asn)/glutamyl-tRNA(Gln) amidotransferase subunit C
MMVRMAVSEKDVARVAELASLESAGNESSRMLHDLNSILDYVAQLNELDTSQITPMAQVGEQVIGRRDPAATALRADEEVPSLSRDRVLSCAPDTDGIYFRVPKVIER